jgi:hypothetical protein
LLDTGDDTALAAEPTELVNEATEEVRILSSMIRNAQLARLLSLGTCDLKLGASAIKAQRHTMWLTELRNTYDQLH